MRRHTQGNLLRMLEEIQSKLEKTTNPPPHEQVSSIKQMLTNIKDTLQETLTSTHFANYTPLIDHAIKSLPTTTTKTDLHLHITQLKKLLKSESEVKTEILFLPYKFSMWDSLESIWLTAKEDPTCHCTIVPVPYYEKNNQHEFTHFHDEYTAYTQNDIPVTPFQDYQLHERKPDITYFHNPYDNFNHITSIIPLFYSNQLKQYTDMLVYVPYFIAGAYRHHQDAAAKCQANGVKYADKVIVQSNPLKKVYYQNGVDEQKIAVLGSPKIDAILADYSLSHDWTKTLPKQKTILLNSSLGRLLSEENYLEHLQKQIKLLLENKDVTLIWRPHPLTEETIHAMREEYQADFQTLKQMVKRSENGVLDLHGNPIPAIRASNAMISDNSSLIRSYIMTGKPILAMESSEKVKDQVILSCDVYGAYFYHDGISTTTFLDMVREGKDPRKEKRLNDFKNSIAHTDGRCGHHIHHYILKELAAKQS